MVMGETYQGAMPRLQGGVPAITRVLRVQILRSVTDVRNTGCLKMIATILIGFIFGSMQALGNQLVSVDGKHNMLLLYVYLRFQGASTSEVIGVRNEMMMDDYDSQMILGDLVGLNLPDIRLTGEEKPKKKTHPRNLSQPGIEPGPAA